MFSKEKKGGILRKFSSKNSFIFGLVVGILAICTIGFFILLGVFLDEKGPSDKENNKNTNQQANIPTPSAGANNLKEITKDDHIRGNKDAPIVLVEFSDFQCPFCSKVHPTLKRLFEEYNGQIAWVYKHLPLDSLHPYARYAAEASECAADQGMFWEYADELYAGQPSIGPEYIFTIAQKIGLNVNRFEICVNSGKFANIVKEDENEAKSVGISGTPGIYINDTLIKGAVPYENFKQVIDSILTSS